ncbi:MAG: Asp-tRNA(Asn)/Glu-tRNA(Gln) amidotransferase subunit GatB [Planctomycetaceae bacterium]|nr:Asp-tRNA(Asn)/Glu-tRNA(Gln) amidotransferase subunit GatB [Planctomycetaceae bacterium]
MDHQLIVGLEVHVQLLTQSKLFSGCINRFNPDEPNSQTDPVTLGLPGTLPVLNRRAVDLSIRTGLALNCEIAPFTRWDRKQYYYPDLPKAYQISQYDLPIAADGWLEFVADEETGERRRVRLIRAHLEEDAGKNLHDDSGRGGESRVDLNRCGTPLLEIVTQPDLRSAADSRKFLEELRLLLSYLEVSDCNMQEGSLRCDANVNLKVTTDDGHEVATPIAEIKNLNSFRGVEAAIEYEEQRQLEEWQRTGLKMGDVGGEKETRGWDADRGITFSQRGKEEAADYRYFPDPDLPPLTVSAEWLEEVRATLCEPPADRRERLQAAWALSAYDASVIIDRGRRLADYFEEVARLCGDGKQAANWVTQEVLRIMNDRGIEIGDFPISAPVLGTLLERIVSDAITVRSARTVFADLLEQAEGSQPVTVDDVDRVIDAKGLRKVEDTGQLEAAADAVLARNAKIADDVRGGKTNAVGPLIGQVMKEVRGADARAVRELLLKKING